MKLTEDDFKIEGVCVWPCNHPTWIYFIELCRSKILGKKDTEQLKQQILENQRMVKDLKELVKRYSNCNAYPNEIDPYFLQDIKKILKGDKI